MTEFKINRKSKKIKNKKIWLIVMSFNIVLLTIAILILFRLYRILMMSNIFTNGKGGICNVSKVYPPKTICILNIELS